VFSPSPEQIEYAELLLRRANGDLQACRVLADADLPLTHDLKFLMRQVRETGTEPPQNISDTAWLTPSAAELRYDEPIAFDRTAALTAAESATGWAASLLANAKLPQPDPERQSREEAPPTPEP
jgi:HEPN domain-containing protein